MKAMKLTGIREMELFEVETPEITKDNEVLIKMTHIGVCGSDVHYYTTGKIGSQVVQYPFTVGHEGSGIIEKTGKNVKSLKPGDRVAIDPAMPCYNCDQYKSGRFHTCRKLKFLGCPGQAEGCLSEYIVMPEKSCFKIDNALTLEDASLSEPLTIGVYAVKLAQIQNTLDIAILGSGPIGLSVLAALKASNPNLRVYVTDKLNHRLKIAQKSGALWTGNPDTENVVEIISTKEPKLMDMVFECCGQQEAADQALEILKPGGKLMQIGIPEFEKFAYSADIMRRKEICIQNVRRQNESLHECLEQMKLHKLVADHWVTHRFSLTDCKKAFDLVADYSDGVLKAMIVLE